MCVAAAVAGGAIVSAGIGAAGASSAAGQEAGAAENAQAISQGEFNTITGQEQPYLQSGYGAQSQLNYLLGITPQTASGGAVGAPQTGGGTPSGLGWSAGMQGTGQQPTPATAGAPLNQSSAGGGFGSLLTPFSASMMQQYSPAYQFQLQQGQQGTLNQDAGAQGALSGAALKDLTSFNQNYANTAYNNAFNQYQTQQSNTYNRLAGIAGSGQNAAANLGQQGTQLAGQAAQSATNIGVAQAGGTVGAANALGGGANTALTSLQSYLNGQNSNVTNPQGGTTTDF